MTKRHRGQVLQAIRDLVAQDTNRRCAFVEVPAGELPVGVAARLALVWAGRIDRALLTGGAARGTEATKVARRELLSQSVGEGALLDLLDAVSLPVRCGRAIHWIRLEPDDELVAVMHQGLDLDSERVAASLGGDLLPCVQAIDNACASWAPPVADDGPRLVGVDAGELLAFVRGARLWLRRGYDLNACAPALEVGVAPDAVDSHLGLGMSVASAVEWRGVEPFVALRWDALGFSRADVDLWVSQGRTLDEAEAAAAAAGNGRWLARWARIAGGGLPADALAEWACFGVPVGVWGEAAARGLRARDVPAWLAEGFQPVEVLRYAHLRVALPEAVTWRDAGFTAYVATGYLGVGMTLEDVCALRGLPTKQVQELWPRCRSVTAVLEAVASSAHDASSAFSA